MIVGEGFVTRCMPSGQTRKGQPVPPEEYVGRMACAENSFDLAQTAFVRVGEACPMCDGPLHANPYFDTRVAMLLPSNAFTCAGVRTLCSEKPEGTVGMWCRACDLFFSTRVDREGARDGRNG